MESICKRCGAKITWCMMANGAKVPLDAKPITMIQVMEGIGEDIEVYRLHFLTCNKNSKERR